MDESRRPPQFTLGWLLIQTVLLAVVLGLVLGRGNLSDQPTLRTIATLHGVFVGSGTFVGGFWRRWGLGAAIGYVVGCFVSLPLALIFAE